MTKIHNDLNHPQNEVSIRPVGGAPFLIGAACWVAARMVYRHTKAVVATNSA